MLPVERPATDHPASPATLEAAAPAPGRHLLTWRIALGVFCLVLLWRAWRIHVSYTPSADWAWESSAEFGRWMKGLAWYEVALFAWFCGLGLLIPAAFPRTVAGFVPAARRTSGWILVGLVPIVICTWIAGAEFPRLGNLLVPLLGVLAGLRLSGAWFRGVRPWLWASLQLALIPVVLAVATAGAVRMALTETPLDFEPAKLTTADKHRLADWIRDSRPVDGKSRTLRLADTEIDALLNTVLGRGSAARKARVDSRPEDISAEASLALPERIAPGKFLNVRAVGHVSVDQGRLDMNCSRLEIGRLSVPRFVLALTTPLLRTFLLDDPQIHVIVGSIESLQPETGAITTTFEPGSVSRRVVPSLAQLVWDRPDVAPQTEIYVRQLIDAFGTLPPASDRFGLLVQSAFQLARERSVDHDPVLENRAAIFALAILLGHAKLETFVGELLTPEQQAEADRMLNVVELRGRQDWPRHFLVSAALALLSTEATSNRIGLLKEQLDSGSGGSGFSFGDLLANRAGMRFALAATRDGASAVAMQKRLSDGFEVAEFFPPAEDLPEGITDAEFASRYGGLGGPGYLEISNEIDRRLARLPTL